MIKGIQNEIIEEYAVKFNKVPLKNMLLNESEIDSYMKLLLISVGQDDKNILELLANEYYDGTVVHQDRDYAINMLKNKSLGNGSDSDFKIGEYYYISGEYAKAIEIFEKCINSAASLETEKMGYYYACMGDSYLRIYNQDYSKAIHYLNTALDKYNNAYAAYRLGTIYSNKDSRGSFDSEKAIRAYEKALEFGYEGAAKELARKYMYGDEDFNIPCNIKQAFSILNPYSNSADPETLLLLGKLNIMEGNNISPNYRMAYYYFKRALENNNDVYEYGYIASLVGYSEWMCHETEEESIEAFDYLIQAHERGCFNSSQILGKAYYEGGVPGIEIDHIKAKEYYHASYSSDNINCFQCCNYIELLLEGDERVIDYELAFEVANYGMEKFNDIEFAYIKAKLALSGKIQGKMTIYDAIESMEYIAEIEGYKKEAHLILGEYYLLNRDFRRAEMHYVKAFDNGAVEAGLKLARLYEYGGGSIRPDTQKGVEWYRKAADAGDYEAKKELECFVEKVFGGYKRTRTLR